MKQRLIGISQKIENAMAKIGEEIFLDEAIEKMIDVISRDRIHSDDDERKSPATMPFEVNHGVKGGQKKKTPSAAEHYPARRPNSFYNRTNPERAKDCSGSEADETRDC